MVGNKLVAIIAGLVGVLVVAAAGVYLYQEGERAKTEAPQTAETEKPSAAVPPVDDEEAPAEDQTAEAPADGKALPSFDVVRFERSGEGVIAGRAEPGWQIMVMAGDKQIAEVVADEDGQWTIVLEEPLEPGDHTITLKGISKDGTRALSSQQSVLVALGEEETVVALSEPGQPTQMLAGATVTADASPDGPIAVEEVAEATVWYRAQRPAGTEPSTPGPRTAWYNQTREGPAGPPPPPAATIIGAVPTVPPPEGDAPWYQTPRPPGTEPATPGVRTAWYNQLREDEPVPGTVPSTAVAALDTETEAQEPKSEDRLEREPATDAHVTRAEEARPQETEIQKTPAKVTEPVAFVTADYQEPSPGTGMVFVTGTAQPGANVVLYVNNDPVGEVRAGVDGRWSFSLPRVLGEGEHRIRADQISEPTYEVVSRAEIGMERREPPAVVAEAEPEAPAPEQPREVAVAETAAAAMPRADGPTVHVVVRGDTLWEIAERYLGGGWRYTRIYRDNRKQIRNPHWIYPNQKFHIPEQ